MEKSEIVTPMITAKQYLMIFDMNMQVVAKEFSKTYDDFEKEYEVYWTRHGEPSAQILYDMQMKYFKRWLKLFEADQELLRVVKTIFESEKNGGK